MPLMETSHLKPHALVVGGTGMLRGVVRRFLAEGWRTSVVARGRQRMESLEREAGGLPGSVVPLLVDYRNEPDLEHSIGQSQVLHGPISVAVCWIHACAPGAPGVVAKAIGSSVAPPRLIHVRASATTYPGERPQAGGRATWRARGVEYAEVILGYLRRGESSRWLTDDEICEGVWRAYTDALATSVVGRIDPWDERP